MHTSVSQRSVVKCHPNADGVLWIETPVRHVKVPAGGVCPRFFVQCLVMPEANLVEAFQATGSFDQYQCCGHQEVSYTSVALPEVDSLRENLIIKIHREKAGEWQMLSVVCANVVREPARHGIQIAMEEIQAWHPALPTAAEWLAGHGWQLCNCVMYDTFAKSSSVL